MKRTLCLVGLAAIGAAAWAQENVDPDRRKNASALYTDGLRAETQPPINLAVAIVKYGKAITVAEKEGNKEVGAAATAHAAMCNEKLDPENITEALAKWKDAAEKFADDPKWGQIAKDKTSWKGVDIHLEKLHAALDAWRVTTARVPSLLAEQKAAAQEKIKAAAPDKEGIPGLLWGLGHRDEVIRDFAGGLLAEVIDEPGIALVIAKLNDPNPHARAGASNALQKIYKKFNEAAALDQRASNIERDINVDTTKGRQDPKADPKQMLDKLKQEAQKLKDRANEIRHNIPANLATADIQTALEKILSDESADAQARREAAGALLWIGQISGPLTDALVKGMDSKDRNVREACCRAAGGVNTAISTDKHKLADRLMKAVMDEPAKGESREGADWANDEAVRQASAEALQQIALVKTLPALIKALDDNDTRVRTAAFQALKSITDRDFAYEKDDKGQDKTYEPDKPLEERKKGKAKWEEWWNQTKGVVVLVERFWRFQSRSSDADAVKLFDPAMFLKEVDSRKWTSSDPKADEDRAKRIVEDFQKVKDVFVQDAVDLGGEALDNLLVFIGGEVEKEKNPNPATRYFVAEASARLADKAGGVDKIVAKATGGETAAKKAGGATSIGFLPREKVDESCRDALTRALGAPEPEIKEAAAKSLGKVGNDASASPLTTAATDPGKLEVQIASLRALALLHPKNSDTVKALSDLVADEPNPPGKRSLNQYVREYAVDALGTIGDPAAMNALLRACRDEMKNVREAARVAVSRVAETDKAAASKACLTILNDEHNKVDDRSGAALALGFMGDAGLGKDLARRLRDPNPPREIKDRDPGVRIKICEAMGNLGAKGKSKAVVGALLAALKDESETEAVRVAAYKGLKGIYDLDPEAEGAPPDAKDKRFNYGDPLAARNEAIKKWEAFADVDKLPDTQ